MNEIESKEADSATIYSEAIQSILRIAADNNQTAEAIVGCVWVVAEVLKSISGNDDVFVKNVDEFAFQVKHIFDDV